MLTARVLLAALVFTGGVSAPALAEEDLQRLEREYHQSLSFTKSLNRISKGVSLGYGAGDQSPWKADFEKIRNRLLQDKAMYRISDGCKKDNYCLNNWTKRILILRNDKFAERRAAVLCAKRRYDDAREKQKSLTEKDFLATADGKNAVNRCVATYKGNPDRAREMLAGATRIHRSVERMNAYYAALGRLHSVPTRREIAHQGEEESEPEVDIAGLGVGGV